MAPDPCGSLVRKNEVVPTHKSEFTLFHSSIVIGVIIVLLIQFTSFSCGKKVLQLFIRQASGFFRQLPFSVAKRLNF